MVGPYSAPTYHTLGSTTPSGSYLQQVKYYLNYVHFVKTQVRNPGQFKLI